MAKTIRDMAIEFGWTQEEDGRGYAAFCFDKGANTVLEEVESIAFSDIGSYKSILDKIQNKIKQLKGEQL